MKRLIVFASAGMMDPASRIRGYYMAKYLSENGFDADVFFYESVKGGIVKRGIHLVKDFLKKIGIVTKSDRQTLIYIQRGVNWLPQPSLAFYFFSKFVLRKKMIYDIDDGLFINERFTINNIIKFSDLVVVGGHELFNYVKKLNKYVILIPTSADLKRYPIHDTSCKSNSDVVRLGFLGSPSTTEYLKLLVRPLGVLAKSYDFELRVISAASYAQYKPFNSIFESFEKRGVNVKLMLWSLEDEFCQLQNIDVGLAPLFNGEWEKYKCGFKVINYMAAGIPPVASDVSEHRYIIQDGLNGFLCKNDEEWVQKLRRLIEDKTLREKMGANARKTVEKEYSLERNTKILAKFLTKLF